MIVYKTYHDKYCEYKYGIIEYVNNSINPDLEIERYNIAKKNKCIDKIALNISNNINKYDPIIPDKYFNKTEIEKYKNISCSIIFKNNTLSYKNIDIKINEKLYNKICNDLLIKVPTDTNINTLIWCILFRYQYMSILNMIQLAILPKYYEKFKKKYNSSLELFGSIINHNLPYFCSLFYDLEKYFGSRGNHYNIELIRGFYIMNPPFEAKMMIDALEKMIENLNKNNKVGYLITIPIWDTDGVRWVNKNCKKKVSEKFGDFKIVKKILKHKKLQFDKRFCKENFKYFDYITFTKINAAPTHMFFLF